MPSQFTYHFDELPIVDGLSILAAGEADISYKICPAEPDVGIFEKYIGDIEIDEIRIYKFDSSTETKQIDFKHWLYPLVYDALTNDMDGLTYACEDDASNNYED